MRTFVGLIIVIISISIITFQCWFYHFSMIAFGRGLVEASFSERAIATFFTSLPFVVFIYLAFKYLIFESNDTDLPTVTRNWSLLAIVLAYLGFSIVWFPTSNVAIGIFFSSNQKRSETACAKMASEAHNTAAAILDYFSNPENITLPSVAQLIQEEYLSTDLPVTIEAGADGEAIVTVIDDNAKCPNGKKYVFYLNGMEPEWRD